MVQVQSAATQPRQEAMAAVTSEYEAEESQVAPRKPREPGKRRYYWVGRPSVAIK